MSNQLQFSSISKYVAVKLMVILALKKMAGLILGKDAHMVNL